MMGLMQNWPLTVDKIIDHARTNHPTTKVISRSVEGPIVTTTYADIYDRSKQVSTALLADGLKLGDVVGTLAWNTARHVETWYGAMGIGIVVHTLNPRLHPQQLATIINHGGDKLLFLDLTFVPLMEQICKFTPQVTRYVVLTDAAHMPQTTLPNAVAYEEWIAGRSQDVIWGNFPEDTACGLCYTSGTTGNPKGVLYSHRSNFLHTLMMMQKDCTGVSAADITMPIVPMFHANAWGMAFGGPASGTTMVMPGPKLDGASICELINAYNVTFTAGVPTVSLGMLQYLEKSGTTLPKGRMLIGGAPVPESVIIAFEDKYGVEIIHAWGMTETSPLGTVGGGTLYTASLSPAEQRKMKLKQGRPPLCVEMKVVDDNGQTVQRDGTTSGRLMVRGPAIASGYLKVDAHDAFQADGFFDTGDIANLDVHGYMQITDRAKDLIKSGGEWISSATIETIAIGAPGVANAAVIGIPHAKWDERPLLIIEPRAGENPTKESVLAFLEGKIAKWWTPDDVVFMPQIPLGPTGKVNKLALRETYRDLKFG